tara:strand:- start:738 stop:911 length:174 start_codon:yes stop_codon:yes gene_type:complete
MELKIEVALTYFYYRVIFLNFLKQLLPGCPDTTKKIPLIQQVKQQELLLPKGLIVKL